MSERSRIAAFFAPLTRAEAGSFSLTDDAAVLQPPTGYSLVVTTDSVIEGIHIVRSASPQQFAQKMVRRNLSDLAAMGAKPWRYFLNLHTPAGLPDAWFAAFAAALAAEQQHFGMVLAGGDSTSGGEVIHATLTCLGLLQGTPLLRSEARAGDEIYVSGTLGDAAYALQHLSQVKNANTDYFAARYFAPTPRLELGQRLHGLATSCIDISDGLISDVSQICVASQCGAVIEQTLLPLSVPLQHAALDAAAKHELALTGGDDYELCFTAPEAAHERVAQLAQELHIPLTCIGKICAGGEVRVVDEAGQRVVLPRTGYEHA